MMTKCEVTPNSITTHKSARTRNRVQFKNDTSIQIYEKTHLSKSDMDSLWYSTTELLSIKRKLVRDITKISELKDKNLVITRGLERYTTRGGHKKYKARVRSFQESVVRAHHYIRNSQEKPEEVLAKFCLSFTKADTEQALRLGRLDTREVENNYLPQEPQQQCDASQRTISAKSA